MMALTPRQAQVKKIIADRIAQDGTAPTVRELCRALGINSSGAIHGHLTALEERGHIRRLHGQARAIEVVA